MDNIWFEDELTLSHEVIDEEAIRIEKSARGDYSSIAAELSHVARGFVRVQKPDWMLMPKKESNDLLTSGQKPAFYLIRMIFEFEIPNEQYQQGLRFTYARCSSYIWTTDTSVSKPEVYDLYPKDLYEGEPQKVSLKIGPEITVDKISGSVGEMSSDVVVGQISPVTVGYLGKDKQEPHWELRPQNKSLLGRQYLWMVICRPYDCDSFRLSAQAEAVIETKFGPFTIGPKIKSWDRRPSIRID